MFDPMKPIEGNNMVFAHISVCILDSGAYALKQFDLGRIFSATSVLISSNVET
ncbi:unnamed protein product [Brassica oleracea var. botrytis]